METVSIVMGGIGLFLLGMILMTDGLKALAGDSLKQQLSKFTGGIFPSIFSGTLVTAILQSSSATTLMTIGFVSAGMLSFTQSVGVILGANLGSTSIGWIVSLIGLKVSVSAFALPLIGIGALLKFLPKGKYSAYGMAIAGLGLLFLGIGTLQDGMADLATSFSFDFVNGHSLLQKLLLVFIGIIMTIIMQSSSTAMVITLTALAATALTFEQAAILVIGQNIGTTAKAFVVTIGGTIQARRTAMSHILFNMLTAIITFLFLPWIIWLVTIAGHALSISDSATLLALFSTVIYVLGIIVIIPLLDSFIKVITYIVPEKGDPLTKYLDPSVATVTPIAIEAVRRTLIRIIKAIAIVSCELFQSKKFSKPMTHQLEKISAALNETRQFLSEINDQSYSSSNKGYQQQVALIHAIDHFGHLVQLLKEPGETDELQQNEMIQQLSKQMSQLFLDLFNRLTYEEDEELVEIVKTNSLQIADIRRTNRKEIIENTVLKQADVNVAIQNMHTLHWIDRAAYHLWRTMHHLNVCLKAEGEAEKVVTKTVQ